MKKLNIYGFRAYHRHVNDRIYRPSYITPRDILPVVFDLLRRVATLGLFSNLQALEICGRDADRIFLSHDFLPYLTSLRTIKFTCDTDSLYIHGPEQWPEVPLTELSLYDSEDSEDEIFDARESEVFNFFDQYRSTITHLEINKSHLLYATILEGMLFPMLQSVSLSFAGMHHGSGPVSHNMDMELTSFLNRHASTLRKIQIHGISTMVPLDVSSELVHSCRDLYVRLPRAQILQLEDVDAACGTLAQFTHLHSLSLDARRTNLKTNQLLQFIIAAAASRLCKLAIPLSTIADLDGPLDGPNKQALVYIGNTLKASLPELETLEITNCSSFDAIGPVRFLYLYWWDS